MISLFVVRDTTLCTPSSCMLFVSVAPAARNDTTPTTNAPNRSTTITTARYKTYTRVQSITLWSPKLVLPKESPKKIKLKKIIN